MVLTKLRIRGKIYYVIEKLQNKDEDFINDIWKIKNTKDEEFVLIATNRYKIYTLYDNNGKKVLSVKHITEVI